MLKVTSVQRNILTIIRAILALVCCHILLFLEKTLYASFFVFVKDRTELASTGRLEAGVDTGPSMFSNKTVLEPVDENA